MEVKTRNSTFGKTCSSKYSYNGAVQHTSHEIVSVIKMSDKVAKFGILDVNFEKVING